MDIQRIYEAITVLTELSAALGELPADERETAGLRGAFDLARGNLERLAQHYAQLCSFPDALWTTAMEGGSPSPEASAETAMLLRWLAQSQPPE